MSLNKCMSTVLRREPPFKSLMGYATLFGDDGRPMHKSWGNAIDFDEAAERMGVDVMARRLSPAWFGEGWSRPRHVSDRDAHLPRVPRACVGAARRPRHSPLSKLRPSRAPLTRSQGAMPDHSCSMA